MITSVIGRNRTPASNAVYPRIVCMYRLRKKNVANIPSDTLNATAFPAENAGIRNRVRGIIALGLRISHTRNATSRTTNPASEDTIRGSVHPISLDSIRP